jgi:hypothetical protein
LAFAFTFTASQSSSGTRIERNGVIELRTDSLNPNTSQKTGRWVHQCQPTKGLQKPAKSRLRQSKEQLRVLACHAL